MSLPVFASKAGEYNYCHPGILSQETHLVEMSV